MTNFYEKTLEYVKELKTEMNNDSGLITFAGRNTLNKLCEYVSEEYIKQTIKEQGGSKEVKRRNAAKALIKENKERPDFQGAILDNDKNQYFITAYYGVKILSDFALRGFIELPKTEFAEKMLATSNHIINRDTNDVVARSTIALRELKEQIAKQKAAKMNRTKFIPKLYINDCLFNPAYVANCMEILGVNEVILEFASKLSPIVFHTDKGVGFVIPMKLRDAEHHEEYIPEKEKESQRHLSFRKKIS